MLIEMIKGSSAMQATSIPRTPPQATTMRGVQLDISFFRSTRHRVSIDAHTMQADGGWRISRCSMRTPATPSGRDDRLGENGRFL